MSGRRIFIGDVQGCACEMAALVEAVGYRRGEDDLWFAGDLVNRGPDSLGALELAIELDADAVLGNHDVHLLRVASGDRSLREDDTLDELLASPRRAQLVEWLRRRPLVRSWDDLLLVHAGICPTWPDVDAVARRLEGAIRGGTVDWHDRDLQFLTGVRRCDATGRRPSRDDSGEEFVAWDEHYDGGRTVVFGHWAARGLVRGRRVRGLDSGCVWGGRLTAWIAEEDRFVSVPALRTYQETG